MGMVGAPAEEGTGLAAAMHHLLVLALLSKRPNYAYRLHRELEALSTLWAGWGGAFRLRRVYHSFEVLRERGSIAPAQPSSSRVARQRDWHAVTEAGRHELRDFVASPMDSEPDRSEFIIRAMSIQGVDDALALRRQFQQIGDSSRRKLTALGSAPADDGDPARALVDALVDDASRQLLNAQFRVAKNAIDHIDDYVAAVASSP